MNRRLPEWLTVKAPKHGAYEEMAGFLKGLGLNTVCQSASCPNIGECFSKGTATFMILGDVCTRSCGFCGVNHGTPETVNIDEPLHVAQASARMGLNYIVVTSVTRDDLIDGGAGQFAETIRHLKEAIPGALVEVLIPDLQGDGEALRTIIDAEPFVLNHNVETVARLYTVVRPQANYKRSLKLLETAKAINPSIYTKSGFMVGFGETDEEVVEVMHDLHEVGCEIVTIGQYLRPSKENLDVVEYIPFAKFDEYKKIGESMGFRFVAAGPFVRSSYHASEIAETSG